uniref:Uncharacterized protein n=1 Tax=Panagrolaimus sp. JU765 TaxID=591449 RepID=A0AC34PV57_9BILA
MNPPSSAEIDSCTQLINSMRMAELHSVLQSFDVQRAGLKRDLLQRIVTLMRNPRTGSAVCSRIREVNRSSGTTRGGPTVTNYNQVTGYAVHRPVPANVGPRMATAAVNNYPYNITPQLAVPTMMASKIGGRFENMQITRLPFYDVECNVLKISELPASQIRAVDARINFTFSIPAEFIPFTTYSNDPPLPRHEIQLRVFMCDMDMEQADDFPPNCNVRIGNQPVALPPIIPTNKPNAEQKRQSRPVDITAFCQPNRRNGSIHKIEIDWTADRRVWGAGIWIVRRLNSDILLDRMRNDLAKRRSITDTKRMITVMLDGDDDNIALAQLKISLLDPLMKTRMKIPTRTKNCNHLQCFDLFNYLLMNEKKPTWKCPNCPANGHYDNLVIDEYFEDLLKSVNSNVTEVELLRDGNWKITQTNEDNDSTDDEMPKPKKEEDKPKSAKKMTDDNVICLSSDDESPAPRSVASSSRNPSGVSWRNGAGEPANKSRRKNSSVASSDSESSHSDSTGSRKRKRPAAVSNRTTTSSTPEVIELSDDEATPNLQNGQSNGQVNLNNGHTPSPMVGTTVAVSNGNVNGQENHVPTSNTTIVNGNIHNDLDTEKMNKMMLMIEVRAAEEMTSFIHKILARDASMINLTNAINQPHLNVSQNGHLPFNNS